MGSPVLQLTLEEFSSRLQSAHLEERLAPELTDTLYRHYAELCRWNPRLSLIGPGTVHEAVERHYAESLAAGPLLGEATVLVDLGSGGGFPGLVLAAAFPNLAVTLVEPRLRKVLFLRSAIERCRLSSICLDARVGAALPGGLPPRIDLVTVRALRLDPATWQALERGLPDAGRVLWWTTRSPAEDPPGWRVSGRIDLPGRSRAIIEYSKDSKDAKSVNRQ